MHLHRVTPDMFELYNMPPGGKFLGTRSDDFRASTLHFDGDEPVEVVVANFPRFGGGKHRKSDFEVYADWQDIERIIDKFCEAKHPEALALRQAQELAKAMKELGWSPPQAAT